MMPIIRNYDGAVTAMAAMVAGFVTNIIFDWLFVSVLSYGVEGAAVATLMGQAVTVVPAVISLTRKVGLFHYACLLYPSGNGVYQGIDGQKEGIVPGAHDQGHAVRRRLLKAPGVELGQRGADPFLPGIGAHMPQHVAELT